MQLDRGQTSLFLMPSDGRLEDPSGGGIGLAGLEERLKAVPATRRVAIFDACYTDAGRGGVSTATRDQLRDYRGVAPAPVHAGVGRLDVRTFAAYHYQPATEDEQLGHGVYTHYLLKALEGHGDKDQDGGVDVVEAHLFAAELTTRRSGGA